MKFDANAPFPEFWFETNSSWGNVTSIDDLGLRITHYQDGTIPTVWGIIEATKSLKRNEGRERVDFGIRREHTGTETLYDFLAEHKVIVEGNGGAKKPKG